MDPGTGVYTYTPPTFQSDDVQVLSSINNYFPYGGDYIITISGPSDPDLAPGTYTITTLIEDTELRVSCNSTLVVEGKLLMIFFFCAMHNEMYQTCISDEYTCRFILIHLHSNTIIVIKHLFTLQLRYRQKETPELFSWEFSCNQLAHRESIACNWL